MTTTATTEKKTAPRLTKIEDMEPKDLEAFQGWTEARQEEYKGRLALQDARDTINAAREKGAAERAEKTASRAKEKSIKELITKVRANELEATMEVLGPLFAGFTPPLPTDEYTATLGRIKTDSVSRQKTVTIPLKPAYDLTRKLIRVMKDEIVAPEFTTLPDATQANSVRRYGMILPIVVRVDPAEGSNKYVIIDGNRRYFLLPDNEESEVLLISGFPDEDTAERAGITVNRVRNLNVLSTANALNRMHTRGIEDAEIRRDMGFKTGEIDKLTSVITNLIAPLGTALTMGNMTPSVALSAAKLPANLQQELVEVYSKRQKETPNNARIAESDVEAVRQKRAAEAAKRDTPTLAGLAGAVGPEDTKSGQVDKGQKSAVESKTPPQTGKKK